MKTSVQSLRLFAPCLSLISDDFVVKHLLKRTETRGEETRDATLQKFWGLHRLPPDFCVSVTVTRGPTPTSRTPSSTNVSSATCEVTRQLTRGGKV